MLRWLEFLCFHLFFKNPHCTCFHNIHSACLTEEDVRSCRKLAANLGISRCYLGTSSSLCGTRKRIPYAQNKQPENPQTDVKFGHFKWNSHGTFFLLNLDRHFAFSHIPKIPVFSGNVDFKAQIQLDWLITCVVMINLLNLSLLWTFN